jgi:hypothetical protein
MNNKMQPAELLHQVKGRVPRSLYEELEYQVVLHDQGHNNKIVLKALFEDTLLYLREQVNGPMVRKEQTSSGMVYRLNSEEDYEEEEQYENFGLLSEPTEEGFLNSFHDIINEKGVEVYRPENSMEQKGRVCAPLFLDAYPDFVVGDEGYRAFGIDCADYGDDRSVIVARVGIHVIDIQAYQGLDGNEVSGRVMNAIEEHKPNEIIIDITGGWGSGLYNNLVSLDIEELCILTGIKFNASPREERFNVPNQRAEMYFLLQERFRTGLITLPRNKELIEELAWVRYRTNLAGQFVIEPKKDFKKNNKRSPDMADALALAFYCGQPLEVY